MHHHQPVQTNMLVVPQLMSEEKGNWSADLQWTPQHTTHNQWVKKAGRKLRMYVCTYGRDQKKVNIAIRNTCVLRTYYSAQLLCVITENTAITKNNYVAQVRYVVPLGSLSVLFKHWLNFDLVSMPLNRRWLTYVEISWPISQLISPVNHTSRWKCSLFWPKH